VFNGIPRASAEGATQQLADETRFQLGTLATISEEFWFFAFPPFLL